MDSCSREGNISAVLSAVSLSAIARKPVFEALVRVLVGALEARKPSLRLILLGVVRFKFLEAFICQLLSSFQLLGRKDFL